MSKMITFLLLMFSVSVIASDLPIQNLSGVMKELQAGDTIYIMVGSTTTPVMVYVIPRNTKDAGYEFSVPVTAATIYTIWHGVIR